MARRLNLTPSSRAGMGRLGVVSATSLGRALSGTLRSVLARDLPGPLDYPVAIPPTRTAWLRRVPDCNLWVFYNFDDAEVRVVALTGSPPVTFLPALVSSSAPSSGLASSLTSSWPSCSTRRPSTP